MKKTNLPTSLRSETHATARLLLKAWLESPSDRSIFQTLPSRLFKVRPNISRHLQRGRGCHRFHAFQLRASLTLTQGPNSRFCCQGWEYTF